MTNKTPQHKIKHFIETFNLEKFINLQDQEYKETSSVERTQLILHECPYCKGINYKGNFHPWRFYIDKDTKQFICYNCSQSGSLFHLLSVFERISIRQVFDKYFSKDFMDLLPQQLTDQINNMEIKSKENIDIPEVTLPDEFKPVLMKECTPGLKYLMERGIKSKSIIEALDIRYCEYCKIQVLDKKPIYIQKRIVFPVKDDQNRIVGFQCRDITGASPLKYYISDGLPKRRLIYNYDNVFNAESIVVCEGIFDALKCWKHNSVALFGKSLTSEQLILLQKMPNLKRIYIALDPDTKVKDKNGNIPYQKLIEVLKNFWQVWELNIPEGRDAGDHSIEEMDKIIENAYPWHAIGLTILI